jgi:hypothetical protein
MNIELGVYVVLHTMSVVRMLCVGFCFSGFSGFSRYAYFVPPDAQVHAAILLLCAPAHSPRAHPIAHGPYRPTPTMLCQPRCNCCGPAGFRFCRPVNL